MEEYTREARSNEYSMAEGLAVRKTDAEWPALKPISQMVRTPGCEAMCAKSDTSCGTWPEQCRGRRSVRGAAISSALPLQAECA